MITEIGQNKAFTNITMQNYVEQVQFYSFKISRSYHNFIRPEISRQNETKGTLKSFKIQTSAKTRISIKFKFETF